MSYTMQPKKEMFLVFWGQAEDCNEVRAKIKLSSCDGGSTVEDWGGGRMGEGKSENILEDVWSESWNMNRGLWGRQRGGIRLITRANRWECLLCSRHPLSGLWTVPYLIPQHHYEVTLLLFILILWIREWKLRGVNGRHNVQTQAIRVQRICC